MRALCRGINLPIQNTEFADIVIESTKLVPVMIDTRNHLGKEMQSILEQSKKYLERNQNSRQTVKDVVCGSLVALLQDPEVRNIPLNPENLKFFVGFKRREPPEKHLKSWAILIINKYRTRLIETVDRDLALHDMAKSLKNIELQEYRASRICYCRIQSNL